MIGRALSKSVVAIAIAGASFAGGGGMKSVTSLSSLGTPAAGASTATASVTAFSDDPPTMVTFSGEVSGLSGALELVHVHEGTLASPGPIKATLVHTATGGGVFALSGTLDLSTGSTLESLASEGLYFDVHTSTYPHPTSSELRGQIRLASATHGDVDIGFPGVKLLAKFKLVPMAGTVSYLVKAIGLPPMPAEAPPVARIHAGDAGVSGPPLFTLDAVGPNVWQGTGPALSLANKIDYLTEGLYLEITAQPGGQSLARGQLRPGYLNESADKISVSTGGEQILVMNAGVAGAGKLFFVGGSLAGTNPPIVLAPLVELPLLIDGYFLLWPNLPVIPVQGVLGPTGEAQPRFVLPPGLNLPVPLTVYHAYLCVDPATLSFVFGSNAIGVTIVP